MEQLHSLTPLPLDEPSFNIGDLGGEDWLGAGPGAAHVSDLTDFPDDLITASLAILDNEGDDDLQALLPSGAGGCSPGMRGSYSMNDLTTLQHTNQPMWNHKLVSVRPKLDSVPEARPLAPGPLNLLPLSGSSGTAHWPATAAQGNSGPSSMAPPPAACPGPQSAMQALHPHAAGSRMAGLPGSGASSGQAGGATAMDCGGSDSRRGKGRLPSVPSTNTLSLQLQMTHVKSESQLAAMDSGVALQGEAPYAMQVPAAHARPWQGAGNGGMHAGRWLPVGPNHPPAGPPPGAWMHQGHAWGPQHLKNGAGGPGPGNSRGHPHPQGHGLPPTPGPEDGGEDGLAQAESGAEAAGGGQRTPSGLPLRKSQSAVELGSWRSFTAGEEYWDHAIGADGIQAGKLTPEERLARILKYREKRQARNFNRGVKYQCRKSLADTRTRVRGRFARNDEMPGPSGGGCTGQDPATSSEAGPGPSSLTSRQGMTGAQSPRLYPGGPCTTRSGSVGGTGTDPSGGDESSSHTSGGGPVSVSLGGGVGGVSSRSGNMGMQQQHHQYQHYQQQQQQQQQQYLMQQYQFQQAAQQRQGQQSGTSRAAGYGPPHFMPVQQQQQQHQPHMGQPQMLHGQQPPSFAHLPQYPHHHQSQQPQQQQQQQQQQPQPGGIHIIGARSLGPPSLPADAPCAAIPPLTGPTAPPSLSSGGIFTGGIFSGAGQAVGRTSSGGGEPAGSAPGMLGSSSTPSMMTYTQLQQKQRGSAAAVAGQVPGAGHRRMGSQTIFSGSNLNLAALAAEAAAPTAISQPPGQLAHGLGSQPAGVYPAGFAGPPVHDGSFSYQQHSSGSASAHPSLSPAQATSPSHAASSGASHEGASQRAGLGPALGGGDLGCAVFMDGEGGDALGSLLHMQFPC